MTIYSSYVANNTGFWATLFTTAVISRIARIRGWVVGRGNGSEWEVRGGLYLPTQLFGVSMSPRSGSHRPRQYCRAVKDISLTQGWIPDPYFIYSALPGPHCLSHNFTWSAKPALEKQTSQLGPLIQQCMGSVWVWLLARPINAISQMWYYGWFSNIGDSWLVCKFHPQLVF